MRTITLPALTVLSGPAERRAACFEALRTAGLRVVPDKHVDGALVQPTHGLPSHPSPEAAKKAKAPNSGHTPGTEHNGKPYKDDPKVAFLAVEGEVMDEAAKVAERFDWQYRLHSCETVREEHELTVEERMARIESDLVAVKAIRGEA